MAVSPAAPGTRPGFTESIRTSSAVRATASVPRSASVRCGSGAPGAGVVRSPLRSSVATRRPYAAGPGAGLWATPRWCRTVALE